MYAVSYTHLDVYKRQALNSAAIYARTNGYVRKWLADIGDHVRAG